MEYVSNCVDDTEALGEALARVLTPGSVVAFSGDLGAGKTAFTRGLARGLGIAERVTSPTFTIVNEYEGGRLPLFHFDMYRLGSEEELFDIRWEDYLARGGVCAVVSGWISAGERERTSVSSPSPGPPRSRRRRGEHEDFGTGILGHGLFRGAV